MPLGNRETRGIDVPPGHFPHQEMVIVIDCHGFHPLCDNHTVIRAVRDVNKEL